MVINVIAVRFAMLLFVVFYTMVKIVVIKFKNKTDNNIALMSYTDKKVLERETNN